MLISGLAIINWAFPRFSSRNEAAAERLADSTVIRTSSGFLINVFVLYSVEYLSIFRHSNGWRRCVHPATRKRRANTRILSSPTTTFSWGQRKDAYVKMTAENDTTQPRQRHPDPPDVDRKRWPSCSNSSHFSKYGNIKRNRSMYVHHQEKPLSLQFHLLTFSNPLL